ncbi:MULTISPECIES: M28 family peptidase [Halomicrobium]|uniref:Carboxypeptidase Q n=2 Tax=Halomicrobium mukohataei TaxID=57705 RepID=C7NXW1_HALMD|nr:MULTISPECIES: M28 family metallopeptidase [Halomicrobium]ACV46549.1 peptidase M28 [Halomicrobium mukohataei DSM 12286]QCD65091.1 M28 family peptidase [Halomicrobium mukohataei]QFR19897.1 M28 family peptidase [Halomicrobium sp. ZPS1]
MTEWIGETFTSDAGWRHLTELVDTGTRMAGSEGERAAAEATRDALAEYARDAGLSAFDIQGWEREASAITADGETVASDDRAVIALPRSPAGSVTGRLVDAGHGLPEEFAEADCEDAVVIARSDVPDWYDRYIHRREKYYHAVEAGAAAFVYVNHVEGMLPPTGSVGTPEEPIGDVPAVGVARETGARLARRYEGETATVSVDCTTPDATSQNVHAELGPDTDEAVLVTSHVDAHDIAEGAMDNGAGTATVVEVAKALAAREGELDTRVEFVAFGAEEVGLVGSSRLADETDLEDVKAVLNLDGVVRGRTLQCYTHGFDGLIEATEAVADRLDHPITTSPTMNPHSDHWPFVQWGVPGIHVMSETDGEGRGWGHTHADTLDKLEPRTLREQAVLLTELAVELADEERALPRRDTAEIATALEEQDLAEGMQVVGDWPYDD